MNRLTNCFEFAFFSRDGGELINLYCYSKG